MSWSRWSRPSGPRAAASLSRLSPSRSAPNASSTSRMRASFASGSASGTGPRRRRSRRRTIVFLHKVRAFGSGGESALWQSPNLEMALDWRSRQQPTALWAKRYGGDFALAMTFLAESEKAKEAREVEMAAKRLSEIRHWRMAFASASALALLLLVAGLIFYEANFAEHVRYYKSFVKRFGEPVGIGELSRDQIRHRKSSLKFVRRGFLHPVLRMEAVDADGNCAPRNSIGTQLQYQQEADNSSQWHE